MKTYSALFLENIKRIAKSYFSVHDLEKLYSGGKYNLGVILHRLAKQGKLPRLIRGYYAIDASRVDWEQFSSEILRPSYISLEYALHYYGIIDQIPARITLVTKKKSRVYQLRAQVIEYSHISPKLYFGYKIQGNFLIAEKEKALLDELYFISLKRRHLSMESLDISKIDKKLFYQWLKKFPDYTQRIAKKLV